MTFRDSYRFTLHTIKENSYRSILTVIISMFLSFLIMGLLCLAVSYGINGNNIISQAFFKENSLVSARYFNYRQTTPDQQSVFTEEYYEPFIQTVDKQKNLIDYIVYTPNTTYGLTFTDPKYPMTHGIKIIEGRNIEPSENRNEAIVYHGCIEENQYSIGETYNYMTSIQDYMGVEDVMIEFTVVGSFDEIEDPEERQVSIDNGEPTEFFYSNIIIDIGAFFNIDSDLTYIVSCNLYRYNEKNDPNSMRTINRFKNLTNTLNKVMPQAATLKPSGGLIPIMAVYYNDPVTCTAYEVYAQNQFQNFLITIVAVGFSVILLLLSVGSLANSVMISIDSSKKFIGLLKALGMRGKTLKLIVILESITLNTIGVLLGYLLLICLTNPLTSVINIMINSTFSYFAEMIAFKSAMYFPFYIFAGSLALFLVAVYLFSLRSLRRIAKMEPIKVINEVS